MSKHTPEPWNGKRIGIAVHYFESIGVEMALTGKSDETMANARRIVACVNACRGLSTDELEQHGLVSAVGAELMKLDKHRDALLAALQRLISSDPHIEMFPTSELEICANNEALPPTLREQAASVIQARAVIAKAKGGSVNHFPGAANMVPDGWQLVPMEPTEAMISEVIDAGAFDEDDVAYFWDSMLAAAPKLEGGAA